MPQLPIVPFGDAAAIILPVDVLESLGLHIGDILDVTGGDDILFSGRARIQLAVNSWKPLPKKCLSAGRMPTGGLRKAGR